MSKYTPGPWTIFHVNGVNTIMAAMRSDDVADCITNDADAYLIAAAPDLLEALNALLDEFGCTLDMYNRNGPDYTLKDGTEVFEASVITARAPLLEHARTVIALAKGNQP